MKKFVNKTSVFLLAWISSAAMAQQMSNSENSCRAKAKEIAAQTYSTCITESRTAQMDQIRKEYQQQLSDLKARYDKELQKMGSKESLKDLEQDSTLGSKSLSTKPSFAKEISSTNITAPSRQSMKPKKPKKSASTGSRPKPTKGIAKTLPTRKEVKTQPVQEPERIVQQDLVEGGSESAPALLSSDEQAAQNEMELTLVPSTDSGSEQY